MHITYAPAHDWCMSRVRTNIEIEDSYVQAIMNRYGVRTKTEAVDLALRHLAGQPMTREEALAMRGARAIGDPRPMSNLTAPRALRSRSDRDSLGGASLRAT